MWIKTVLSKLGYDEAENCSMQAAEASVPAAEARNPDRLEAEFENEPLPPNRHFYALAEGFEEVGIVGRLGTEATGRLWQAMQAWQAAEDSDSREAARRAYFRAWQGLTGDA